LNLNYQQKHQHNLDKKIHRVKTLEYKDE